MALPIDSRSYSHARQAVMQAVRQVSVPEHNSSSLDSGNYVMATTPTLRNYQQEGVHFLVHRTAALLADQAGLGKTPTVARALLTLYRNQDLVTSPFPLAWVAASSSAIYNWERELNRWAPALKTQVLDNRSTVPDPTADVVVFAHSQMSANNSYALTQLRKHPAKIFVVDELQAFKNPNSQRGKTYAQMMHEMQQQHGDNRALLWGVSGSPAPNNYGELYPHLVKMIPKRLAASKIYSHSDFLDRFCVTKPTTYGPPGSVAVVRNKNAPELRKLMSGLVLRRRKKDVLTELPGLKFTIRYLPPGTSVPPNLHTSEERKELGFSKVQGVVSVVADEFGENNEKLILFAHHLGVIEELEEQLGWMGVVTVTGSTTPVKRQRFIDEFQNNPSTRLFLGQLKACSTAINLTAASRVMLAEYSWTPEENYQAGSRAHRFGQLNPVLVEFLVVKGTMDEKMGRTNARKAREIAELFA